jgi:branched-chain amino acid transport system ATP-binding protein
MLLEARQIRAGYAGKQVLYGISMNVGQREIVGLIGHNGAGKSTALKALFGLVVPEGGQVLYAGEDVTAAGPPTKLARGIYHLPQEHFLFDDLTVKDNLEIAFFTRKEKSQLEDRRREIEQFFPVLKGREGQLAGTLSGGERRMLGISMGLLHHPRLLLLDEPSSGLSPVAFQNVARIIEQINRDLGTAVLLVEQNVKVAFKLSRRVYVMKAGHIILEEEGRRLLERGEWWDLF